MKANDSHPPDGVRLIVFDFDQTLSCIHVFKTLAGWSKEGGPCLVPKPHATTERGQVRRIFELSQIEPFRSEHGGFATVAFGGEARVQQLREMLERMQARDVDLVICTKGLVGTVRKCLQDIGLLGFFSEVYGNIGDNYGVTPYDQDVARAKPSSKELAYVSTPDKAAWKSKDKLILLLANRAGLSRDQAVLVEDDPEEIRRANLVCRTMFVKEAAGMTPRHCAALLQLVEGTTSSSSRRPPPSGEDQLFGASGRSQDSRFSRLSDPPPRLEARQRADSSRGSRPEKPNSRGFNDSGGSNRRFEEAPGNVSSMDGSRLEGSNRLDLGQELSKLTLEDDRRPPVPPGGRRSKSCADGGASKVPRRPSRPVSRGSHSRALQAAGSRLMASLPVD